MMPARSLRVFLDGGWAHDRIVGIRSGIADAFSEAAVGLDDPFAAELVDAVAALARGRGWIAG